MKTWTLLAATAAIAVGCRQWPGPPGAFDVPFAAAVLQNESGGPFIAPVGFVASLHTGQIAMLDLKQGRHLNDDPTASFLRTNQLATGRGRLLNGLFPFVQPDDTITVFAFDRAFEQVVEIPYITGYDDRGFPIEPETRVSSEPVFSGTGAATLVDLVIKTGWTSSEDWTVTFDGNAWTVEGSRSGRMEKKAVNGEPYVGVDRVVAFTVDGEPERGDSFTFSTDANLVEHEAAGAPVEVRAAPDQSVAAVLVQVEAGTELRFFDPDDPGSFATSPAVSLPGASPWRLAWDPTSSDLFVSDIARPGAWRLHWDDPTQRQVYTVQHIPLPWPTLDVAPLLGTESDQLFVAPVEQSELWSVDLRTGLLHDHDPWTPGLQGIGLDGPVSGLEAMAIPYLQLARNDNGVRHFRRSVGVSLSSGRVVFADEVTRCLVDDGGGPRTDVSTQVTGALDYVRSFGATDPLGASLQPNLANGQSIMGNPCGGITRSQAWNLRYDAVEQGWRVSGSLSGTQATLAREDVRYLSDDGEISFLIRSGTPASQDGWRMSFNMLEGLTSADGDLDDVGATIEVPMEQPGDPIYFHYEVGPRDDGWYAVDDRPHLLLTAGAGDRVGRVDPQEGRIDATWD